MVKTVQIRARTDAQTKREAEKVLSELGLNPSAAINMFYRQIVMRNALPFPAEIPNPETRAAIEEARSGEGISLSAWLAHAAQDRLRNELLGQALDRWEAEEGPFSDAELAEAVETLRLKDPEGDC